MVIRRAAAAVAVSALLLSSCQTTSDQQPPGAVAGGLVGAASGAGAATGTAIAGGAYSGQNMLVGVLVGAVVGAVAGGGSFWSSLDEADRRRAADAALQSANAASPGPIHWQSEKNKDVFGWAERASPAALDGGELCRKVKSYYYLDDREHVETKRFCFRSERWTEA